jgi:type II secretory pathway pseudopilin PulG
MLHNANLQKRSYLQQNGGFGLVELLVSISIVVLVTGIIVSRHNSYNGAVLLRSQAYEVALQAREVQLSAVSAVGSSGVFRNVYGVHFDTSTADRRQYYLFFRDSLPYNNFYDAADVVVQRGNIDPRFEISQIRRVVSPTDSVETSLSVVFERPNFDARFYTSPSASLLGVAGSAVEIDIRVKGTTGTGVGEVRTVEITKTGQIIVQ